MRLVDCHAHLAELLNLDQELEKAKEVGVRAIVAVGTDKTSNEIVGRISEKYQGYVFPALGLHPWNLGNDIEKEVRSIEKHIEECIALGEVGLDFKYQTPRELQTKAFSLILDLASRYDKPIIVHSRWAWREAFEMVRDVGIKRAVFHWYSGPLDVMREILAEGYYISATPAVEFSEAHKRAIRETPLERLLLETDSPVKYRGVPSGPQDITKTLEGVARLKEVEKAKVAEITTENATEFFNIKL
ncbi:MAG: TatD family hydrolase [Candidatus Hadarchaeales archaeon]